MEATHIIIIIIVAIIGIYLLFTVFVEKAEGLIPDWSSIFTLPLTTGQTILGAGIGAGRSLLGTGKTVLEEVKGVGGDTYEELRDLATGTKEMTTDIVEGGTKLISETAIELVKAPVEIVKTVAPHIPLFETIRNVLTSEPTKQNYGVKYSENVSNIYVYCHDENGNPLPAMGYIGTQNIVSLGRSGAMKQIVCNNEGYGEISFKPLTYLSPDQSIDPMRYYINAKYTDMYGKTYIGTVGKEGVYLVAGSNVFDVVMYVTKTVTPPPDRPRIGGLMG